jgi:hypothetical protein
MSEKAMLHGVPGLVPAAVDPLPVEELFYLLERGFVGRSVPVFPEWLCFV